MALKINNVVIAVFSARPKKMIESHFIEGRRRSVGRNVSADSVFHFVGPDDHSHRVPAHQTFDTTLHLLASGKWRLLANRNRVLVGGCRSEGKIDAGGPAGIKRKLPQQPSTALPAASGHHVVE